MGTTLVQYMVKQKINYACNLLRTTEHTVIRIAAMASFGTLGYFNTVFKRVMGISPTQYRRRFAVIKSD
jgi:AraC-like DNA-binding protein